MPKTNNGQPELQVVGGMELYPSFIDREINEHPLMGKYIVEPNSEESRWMYRRVYKILLLRLVMDYSANEQHEYDLIERLSNLDDLTDNMIEAYVIGSEPNDDPFPARYYFLSELSNVPYKYRSVVYHVAIDTARAVRAHVETTEVPMEIYILWLLAVVSMLKSVIYDDSQLVYDLMTCTGLCKTIYDARVAVAKGLVTDKFKLIDSIMCSNGRVTQDTIAGALADISEMGDRSMFTVFVKCLVMVPEWFVAPLLIASRMYFYTRGDSLRSIGDRVIMGAFQATSLGDYRTFNNQSLD